MNQRTSANSEYQKAISYADQNADRRFESLALAHLAGLEEKSGDARAAATSYQRALAFDTGGSEQEGAKASASNAQGEAIQRTVLKIDPRSAAFDWFDLRPVPPSPWRSGRTYLCVFPRSGESARQRAGIRRAAAHQPSKPGAANRPQSERRVAQAPRPSRRRRHPKNLPSSLARATSLPPASLH